MNPNLADAFDGRGWAYAQKGDYDRAIQDNQALRINPIDAHALRNRSLAYARKGDYLRAMVDRGSFLWLKFGILGISIRLCLLALSVVVAFVYISKRLRANS